MSRESIKMGVVGDEGGEDSLGGWGGVGGNSA